MGQCLDKQLCIKEIDFKLLFVTAVLNLKALFFAVKAKFKMGDLDDNFDDDHLLLGQKTEEAAGPEETGSDVEDWTTERLAATKYRITGFGKTYNINVC